MRPTQVARVALAVSLLAGCALDEPDASAAALASLRSPVSPASLERAPDACGGVDPDALLDPGHAGAVTRVVRSGEHVLSVSAERWILWDVAAGRQRASGAQESGRWTWRFAPQLAGDTALLPGSGRLVDVVDVRDARVLATHDVGETYAKLALAVDGSYVWRADGQTLQVFTRDGTLLLARRGDYANASVYAGPEALYVGARPDGSGEIEVLPVREAAVSPGGFAVRGDVQWFADGARFFAPSGDDRVAYDLTGARVHTLVGGGRRAFGRYLTPVGGYRDRVWQGLADALVVTRVGDADPLARVPYPDARDHGSLVVGSGGAVLGLLADDDATLHQLDLRADRLQLTAQRLGAPAASYDSDARGAWAAGTARGVVYAGTSSAGEQARPLGCGNTLALAISPAGRLAVASDDGKVRVYDVRDAPRLLATFDALTTALGITRDGRFVVTRGERRYIATSDRNAADQSVRVFAVDDGSLVHRFAHAQGDQPAFMDFDVAPDGRIARRLCMLATFAEGNGRTCTIEVTDLHGAVAYRTAPVSYAEPGNPADLEPPLFSPDGRRLAFVVPSADGRWAAATTVLYEDGRLLRTLAGRARGWLDDAHLMLSRPEGPVLTDLAGRPQSTPIALTEGRLPQRIDADHYYDGHLSVRRFHDGSVAWTYDRASQAPLLIAGDFVATREEARVLARRWR